MAGNASRRGAVRRDGSKKGAVVGSGGQRRKGLEPKGPTPQAEQRPGHPAQRRARKAEAPAPTGAARRGARRGDAGPDIIAGRNAVLEALQAGLPARQLLVLDGIEADDRVRGAIALANKSSLSITVGNRGDLDRAAGTAQHQGVVLVAAPFAYIHLKDLPPAGTAPLAVALDHITDPHNMGAIARSAAAFGAAGVIIPQRRSSPVTAATWKASAGALARMPVARVANLASALAELQREGWFVVGLDGAAETEVSAISQALASGPLVIVVGAEGAGLARLTGQRCDLLVRIPIDPSAQSLNASVAAGIALHEVARTRRR